MHCVLVEMGGGARYSDKEAVPSQKDTMLKEDQMDPEVFLAAIGNAVVAWQGIEAQSSNVFGHLLDSRAGLAASAVFYHIKSFATRLDLLNVAARFALQGSKRESLLTRWTALAQDLKKASSLRNQIVHQEPTEEMTDEGWRFSLEAHAFDFSLIDPRNLKKSKQRIALKSLSFSDIDKASSEFRRLRDELQIFGNDLFRINHPRHRDPDFSDLKPEDIRPHPYLRRTYVVKRKTRPLLKKRAKDQPS